MEEGWKMELRRCTKPLNLVRDAVSDARLFIPFYLTLEYELLRLVWKLMVRVIVYQIVLVLRPKERK